MTQSLFISELLFAIISTIALLVVWQLVRTHDKSVLRKIMITYFLIEVFIWGSSGWYFWAIENGRTVMSIDQFRMIIIVPKAIVKLWLFIWLAKQK